ncbi:MULTISPECIES: HNH endonuclease signature motif containing protein [unclassified Streptomyces]|uniref:HNH endonuclease signature motif containing protein n=1 Tax=unclassified Streptomyces TaxID=2593676 RepID=UPI002365CBC0|nr:MULTISPECIES: HNH endonuclease signature motif containing protein [unclassified Streptomyces]MDF3141690.1 HNH endonuclease signature motif containing protein [Streptomyces sp. T21Q-yed]WDF40955.1 HNH endonuclease signature motif containing protein [Streptomyces sp. T12]
MRTFLNLDDKSAVRTYFRERSAIWPDSEGGCWTWEQYRTPDGYGRFTSGGTQLYVHREAYKAFGRRIPDGFTIDHLCGVRNCWNPAHLEAVTQEENSRRGRNAFWKAFMKEHFAARNVVRKLGGSVIEPVEVNR